MNKVINAIGVDVGKEKLDVCYPDGTKETIKNIKSCRTKLIAKAKKLDAVIAFEATGSYEDALADECLESGVKAVRLDSWGTRRFAESQGRLEKTDSIDSEMIRDYVQTLKADRLRFVKPRSEAHKRLKAAVAVRDNLMKAKTMLANQLEHITDVALVRRIRADVRRIEKDIEKIAEECNKAIAEDDRMRDLSERFQMTKGVGPSTTWSVLAYCPDIGEFSDRSIAKYSGCAPLEHKSCTIQKKSRTKRGNSRIKSALHMAAISAVRSNRILREIYQRLLAKGKSKSVALTAVARHLAMLLNTIAKYPDFKPASDDIPRSGRTNKKE